MWVRRAHRRLLIFGLATLVTACGVPGGNGYAPAVDGSPFAGLYPCGDAPFLGIFTGADKDSGDQSASANPVADVYGLKADGTAVRVTTDLRTKDLGISEDARTVFVARTSPLVEPGAPALGVPDELVAIDTVTGAESVLLNALGLVSVAVSPGASQIAVTFEIPSATPNVSYGRLGLLDLDRPGVLSQVPGFDPALEQVDLFPVWSSDGRELAYVAWMADQSMEVRVLDMETGAERVIYGPVGPDSNLSGLDWSADGRTLLTRQVGQAIGEDYFSYVLAVDVRDLTATRVLEEESDRLVYSARDSSTISAITWNHPDEPVMAQTWSQSEDGNAYVLSSMAEIGAELDLVSGSRLVLPDCALR